VGHGRQGLGVAEAAPGLRIPGGLDDDQGGQDEHQTSQPDQRREEGYGWQGGQEHADRHQPWQAQPAVDALLNSRYPARYSATPPNSAAA
jgi:hypothetical protein